MIATRNSAHRSDDTASGGIKAIVLPARSPNLNAYAERWVLSAKQECLSRLILFGEGSLRRALREFIDHFHTERITRERATFSCFPLPLQHTDRTTGRSCVRERLGGLLKYYCGAA